MGSYQVTQLQQMIGLVFRVQTVVNSRPLHFITSVSSGCTIDCDLYKYIIRIGDFLQWVFPEVHLLRQQHRCLQ
jgi:hypothetical protein